MKMPDDWKESAPGKNLEIRVATQPGDLEAVTSILEKGYPVPRGVADFFMRGIHLAGDASSGALANFVAFNDGKPAACSSVCIEEGVAGIYCVATLEEFRFRGIGAAVTQAAMEYASKAGASHCLLHATQMGAPVYRRIGFEEVCRIPVLALGMPH